MSEIPKYEIPYDIISDDDASTMEERAVQGNYDNEGDYDIPSDEVIEARLEAGETPDDILEKARRSYSLTPEYLEAHGATFLQYGLTEDQLEFYSRVAHGNYGRHYDYVSPDGSVQRGPEVRRRLSDEEPEIPGYEPERPKTSELPNHSSHSEAVEME